VTSLVRHGPWQIAVGDDDRAASFVVDDWLEWSDLDPGPLPEIRADAVRAIVEVRRSVGSLLPRALNGGEMRLTRRGARQVQVGQSSRMTLGAAKTYASRLRGTLVPGLPPEFAQATLDGIVRVPADWDSGGLIVVDRAAGALARVRPALDDVCGTGRRPGGCLPTRTSSANCRPGSAPSLAPTDLTAIRNWLPMTGSWS
jgi:hypothetical protein